MAAKRSHTFTSVTYPVLEEKHTAMESQILGGTFFATKVGFALDRKLLGMHKMDATFCSSRRHSGLKRE